MSLTQMPLVKICNGQVVFQLYITNFHFISSREMVKRNTLFKNVVTYLTKNMNLTQEDAKTQVRQALNEKDSSYSNR